MEFLLLLFYSMDMEPEMEDDINPAIQPVFDKIAEHAWREVTKL